MFTSIRKYKVKRGSAEELARRVKEGFVPLIRQMQGFRSYSLLDGGPDVLITISRFDSADEAFASTQLSHRYASDTRNAPENCGVPRPMSICGAKNHCPFRGHLALTGSTLMCWRRCSRNAVRTVGRRKSRLDHRFSLGALQSELPPPWHVWCLNRSAPHNALISSHIFSSGGKVGSNEKAADWVRNNVLEFTKGMPEVMIGNTLIAEVR